MLTRAIIQVGHDLGIEVVAEGIERPEHLELLREMGCELGQGYLIAKPMDARGIQALVGSGWPGGDADAESFAAPGGEVAPGGQAAAPAAEAEFAPDPGPASEPALNPGEAPAPATPAVAPAQ
jgi:predicted signal transduction protein with EAL and GGDEF domain